ncbi:MAG TPA: putative toxin-antitoxin system toxin component, PIN family [Candidatus Elarobacter sp.]|jgi:putative PIN family toxin of toxin-antitoxin system
MTALLDSNVFVSAAIAARDGRPGMARWVVAIALTAQRRFEHVTSDQLLDELRVVLERPSMLGFSGAEAYVAEVAASSTIVPSHGIPMGCRDRTDDKVIETALNANVDFLVSEDADIHEPRVRYALEKTGIGIRKRSIRVATVREFVAVLHASPRFSPLIVPALPPATLAA